VLAADNNIEAIARDHSVVVDINVASASMFLGLICPELKHNNDNGWCSLMWWPMWSSAATASTTMSLHDMMRMRDDGRA
jgi:hypothetical protein